ncbi:MAG TPA: chemotaxis protein CheW [Ramlibacter sp.]|nr:chemotaxis protein CheW [Ramlibacter sp.]
MTDPSLPHDAEPAAILRARARALAQPPAADPGPVIELLEFRLGGARYGIASRCVSEVLPLAELTPVPCTPAFIAGVVNVRGRITAVIDIHRFLQMRVNGLADLHQVILLRGNGLEFGLLADVVLGVQPHPAAALEDAGPALPGTAAEGLLRLTPAGLALVDVDRLLADPRLLVNEEGLP